MGDVMPHLGFASEYQRKAEEKDRQIEAGCETPVTVSR